VSCNLPTSKSTEERESNSNEPEHSVLLRGHQAVPEREDNAFEHCGEGLGDCTELHKVLHVFGAENDWNWHVCGTCLDVDVGLTACVARWGR